MTLSQKSGCCFNRIRVNSCVEIIVKSSKPTILPFVVRVSVCAAQPTLTEIGSLLTSFSTCNNIVYNQPSSEPRRPIHNLVLSQDKASRAKTRRTNMKMRDNHSNMESFYEENAQFSGQAPTITTTAGGGGLKRPLTLDLNAKEQPLKRQRYNNSVNTASVISSPDLQMLKMASPELEKFIMNGSSMQTPTPSLIYPQKVLKLHQIIFIMQSFLLSWKSNPLSGVWLCVCYRCSD